MIMRTKAFIRAILSSILLVVYFICESQLMPFDWVFLLPIGFFIILLFLIRLIRNITFWIVKRNEIKLSWMPLFIQLLAISMACLIPSWNKSKRYFWGATNLASLKKSGCNCNLYVEHYNVFDQGAFGTGLNSAYLTDSLNFRIFLGVYDDGDEHIEVRCHHALKKQV